MHSDHTNDDLPNSVCAILSSILGSLAWISMLTCTANHKVYTIFEDGEVRLIVGGLLATLAFIFFLSSLPALKAEIHKGWLFAGVGLGVSAAILLTIIIPALILGTIIAN